MITKHIFTFKDKSIQVNNIRTSREEAEIIAKYHQLQDGKSIHIIKYEVEYVEYDEKELKKVLLDHIQKELQSIKNYETYDHEERRTQETKEDVYEEIQELLNKFK